MKFTPSPILPEVIIIEPEVHEDQRGFFLEIYHEKKFREAGINLAFVQDNWSHSCKGTLRGLHYQLKYPQGKLIWTLSGEIFDVAVDIRKNSSTFGKWFGLHLSSENKRALYIPPQFAHGFCVLSDLADILYKCTDFYFPEDECGIRWNDPILSIAWPILNPIFSTKDSLLPYLLI